VKFRPHTPRHALPRPRRRAAVTLTVCALAATGTGALLYGFAQPAHRAPHAPVAAVDVARTEDNRVSRNRDRTEPSPSSSPAAPSASPLPTRPRPVAGLDQAQMDNAAIIVRIAAQRGLPKRAMVVAVATSLQESDLYNAANPDVPESLRYPHQGASVDADSVGLFQQRASQGWGTVAQLMDPAYSTRLFFDRLVRVSGWQSMELTDAAQAVQRSGFPGAYQKHQNRAQQIVNALA
jgi:hypothetical protein